MRRLAAMLAVFALLGASGAAVASVTPSCWGILSAVRAQGEIAWLHQCTASLRGERSAAAAEARCRGWLAACRRNPFSGGRPGIITY